MINPAELVEQFNQMFNGAVNFLWFIFGICGLLIIAYTIATYIEIRHKTY